jgi:3-hydroxyacyl-CoA dehydrogenase
VFQHLRASEEAAALRYGFFAEREVKRRPTNLSGLEPLELRHIAVAGAGTMGAGIAAALAMAGFAVTVLDTSDTALERGRQLLAQSLGDLQARNPAATPTEVRFTTDLAAIGAADLAIEAVFEDEAVKAELLARLHLALRLDAIIATNTSYLDVTRLAAASNRADRFVGLHFFAPAHRMRLVEVVRVPETDPQVLLTAFELAKSLGKLPIMSGPAEGFIGNSIYSKYRQQCEFMLEEGATVQDLDAAMQAFGFAMGPFAVGDLSGLDIAWRNRQRAAPTRDPRERYSAILDDLCEIGRFGRKAGAGWYDYRDGIAVPSETTTALIAGRALPGQRAFTAADIQQRVLGAIVNEAALLLADGTASSASAIDLAMVTGFGFSKYRGGPLFLASRMEPEDVEAAVRATAAAVGYGFRPGDISRVVDHAG